MNHQLDGLSCRDGDFEMSTGYSPLRSSAGSFEGRMALHRMYEADGKRIPIFYEFKGNFGMLCHEPVRLKTEKRAHASTPTQALKIALRDFHTAAHLPASKVEVERVIQQVAAPSGLPDEICEYPIFIVRRRPGA
jgi:hypothetical protein